MTAAEFASTNEGLVLVTGGSGFIGSHTCVALAAAGYEFAILDNLSNSRPDVLDRIRAITGKTPEFVQGDVRDHALLESLFASRRFSAVIHFAGLKAVGESVAMPLDYYDNNVSGALALLQAMRHSGVRRLVFSSSATVYGGDASSPIREDSHRQGSNPYARCKIMIEEILTDLAASEPSWRIASLRYFNPAGAHPSGLIGEAPLGVPNNLMPLLTQVAAGQRVALDVFGSDYPTPDGTGVRDYVHVMDIAEGHVTALRHLDAAAGALAVNLGTGQGTSVLELVNAFERASGRRVPYRFCQRRPGDVAECWADTRLAKELLDWSASRNIADICADAWRWQESQAK